MDPNNVVATAQQAVLSSADQVSAEAGATSKHGSASSSQTSSKDAASIRDETSGNGGPSNSKRGSAANGAEKTNATTEASAGGNDGAREEGELSGSRSDSPARQDDDEDAEGVEDYMLEGDAGEMSFVIDTAGDMDVDREIALEGETKADNVETHIESGLLLPSHVNVIPQADNSASKAGSSAAGPSQNAPAGEASDNEGLEDFEGDMGDFEQLDMDPSTANRYYGAEEKAERRAKEQCLACGEFGHDRRHCPHQHCLACGAIDEHPTRFCPLSTSCFRCGGMGHQTRTCPKPRRGPRSEECERCGSYSHVKALCPTLWRVYTYSTLEDFDRHRAKAFFKLQHGSGSRDPRRDLEPDPAELSDSEDGFTRAGEPEAPSGAGGAQFDPATRWCYNCSTAGNHWGDDCPEPRVNPTRGTNEPSAFSEFVSRLGPFAKLLPGAPPLAGFEMPSSQFTFNVGSGATMHVAGDAVPSPRGRNAANGTRQGQSGRDHHGSSSGAPLAIGKHILSSRNSSRTSSPHPSSPAAGPSSRSRGGDSERLVSFDRTKAVESEGGFLTRKEKKKGKTPLPEHLFRQWVRDRHDYPEHADEIRAALEKRAELESKGLDTKSVPSTREIVGDLAGKRGSKRSNDSDSRPSKKRKGDSFSDPVVVDSDDDPDAYRNDGTFSDSDSGSDSDDNAGGRRKKRRGDGKNNRRGRPQKDSAAPHTGWGHAGDGGSGSKGGGPKRGKFSRHNQERRSKPYERDNGASGTNGGGKRRGRRGNGGGGSNNNNGGAGGRGGGGGGGGNPKYNGGGGGGGGGGEKVRGGGSKYRGGYF